MSKIKTNIIEEFQQAGITAGQKVELWMNFFPSQEINKLFNKLLELYSDFSKEDYFPKNPFFPEILNYLYSTNNELAELFIKEFFPRNIYNAFILSEKKSFI